MNSNEIEKLYEFASQSSPNIVELPKAKRNMYEVDLSTRQINSPKFLSVTAEHKAEVVYFVLDRYFDYMDLSNTTCLIQYIAPDGTPYVYIVPFYDIYTFRHLNKMIIPWNIAGSATKEKGKLQYSIRFYKLHGEGKDAKIVYNLNTLPAESEILESLNVDPLNKEEVDYQTDAYEYLMAEVSKLSRKELYWEILD